MSPTPTKHCFVTKGVHPMAVNKAVVELSLVSYILAAIATVVFPISFVLIGNENQGWKNFGLFLFILAWFHVIAILVLTMLINGKYRRGPCPTQKGSYSSAVTMRSGYAIPPPAY